MALFDKVSAAAIFTDCDDKNARHRQSLRIQQLFGVTPIITGVQSDLDAAGQIVDALDATLNIEIPGNKRQATLILGNIAPRHGEVRLREKNGTRFGYFWKDSALVCTTLDGLTLSLAWRLAGVEDVHVFDNAKVLLWATTQGLVDIETAAYIRDTQFRSFEFLPRCARWLLDGRDVPSVTRRLAFEVPGSLGQNDCYVWQIDKFANAKTTIDLLVDKPDMRQTFGLPFYRYLSEVPDDGRPAWVVGSSGFGNRRFAEIVINGGHAAKLLGLKVGHNVAIRLRK